MSPEASRQSGRPSSLRAFISYRHDDEFARLHQGTSPPFVERLRQALEQVGFRVFVDVDERTGLHRGEDYDSTLYQTLEDCDLFVALIGTRWLELLRQRTATRTRDILLQEIHSALRRDVEILPILVDGARMPEAEELPRPIERFHFIQGSRLQSTDTVETMVDCVGPSFAEVIRGRRRRAAWKASYLGVALLGYFLCAINIHLVGISEYGLPAWGGMIKVWSGFFVWPVFFLPFALVALYRPLTAVCVLASKAKRRREVVTYVTPVAVALLITALAVVIEVRGQYEVPWTVNPKLPKPHCASGPDGGPAHYVTLAGYDTNGSLRKSLRERYTDPPFWLEDKCWPNVFFYLTVPAYRSIDDPEYPVARPAVQRAFMTALHAKTHAPYSWTFVAYLLSITTQLWLGVTGVILAVFYVSMDLRRLQDRARTEEAYLCLTYSFVTLMLWVPFRMNTVYVKSLYFCSDLTDCRVAPEQYLNDFVLGIMLLIGYVYLTVALVVRYRRVALTFLGSAAVAASTACAVMVWAYGPTIARMAEQWQFYVGVSIPLIAILTGLWFLFNPAALQQKEFERDGR